ncbi:MAG: aldehyde ferredoxin oxidoreductase family protein [Actinobacteria bacterium]|nr:aldehyde ferredoxin oxidoreductase family protein [Actinomycetota bacterium]MCG2808267.1 aldehyde ferredoxin oxidoreductase family protein [Coriobacteriia bacterium]
MKGGYAGHILRIDLTSREVTEYPWTDAQRRATLGGKVMAAQILYDLLEPGTDPLGPENVLVISTGPLTGTGAPSSARFNLSALSPLTGIVASSNCGGPFGTYLKKAGVDALVITGSSADPVWLEVSESGVAFHSAEELRGTHTSAAADALSAAISEKCGTLVIGPAGENLVRYAAVLSGERAAGRAGLGAVMGAKNLKGLAAHGSLKTEIADRDAFREHVRKWSATLKAHPLTGEMLPTYGTAGMLPDMNKLGIIATSNYRRGQFDGFDAISGQTMASTRLVSTSGCLSCPIRCARVVEVDGHKVKGPELETLVLLGSNLENADLDSICRLNVTLDELGMDTMSAGVTVSLAMELAERGLVDWPLRFGDVSGLAQLFDDIAHRRGIGDELADGSRVLGIRYGAPEASMQVKGLELAAYEPRGAWGHALGYATSNRGGCHLNGGYMVAFEGLGLKMKGRSTRSKPALTAMFQDLMEAVSAAGGCLFTTYAVIPAPLVRGAAGPLGKVTAAVLGISSGVLHVLRAVPRSALGIPMPLIPHIRAIELATGEKLGFGRFWEVGERGFSLERELNVRFGGSSADDTLPGRCLNERLQPDDPTSVVPLARLLPTYYRHRDWSDAGVPNKRLLSRLGIRPRSETS